MQLTREIVALRARIGELERVLADAQAASNCDLERRRRALRIMDGCYYCSEASDV